MKIVNWNPEPVLARQLTDSNSPHAHPDVRHTSYDEVHQLIGTSGCSASAPHWNWDVMGILMMEHGSLLVCPGDYIVTFAPEVHLVIPPDTFKKLFDTGTFG